MVNAPRAGYAITLKLLIYVDARDEDAITLLWTVAPALNRSAHTQ